MATFYKGEEVKFAILLTAEGFDMDSDDFDIEVKSPKNSIKASKGASTEDLVIFKENGSDSSSSSSSESGDTWYAIVNTSKFTATGELKVVATAYVPDTNASGNIRKQIDVKKLGDLKNV